MGNLNTREPGTSTGDWSTSTGDWSTSTVLSVGLLPVPGSRTCYLYVIDTPDFVIFQTKL